MEKQRKIAENKNCISFLFLTILCLILSVCYDIIEESDHADTTDQHCLQEAALDIYNEEMLNGFIAENPLRFSEKCLSLVRRDFYEHKRGTVSDEFVDYVLWAEKSPARHEHFGAFLLPIIRDNSWSSILEVGCGEAVLLSKYLHQKLRNSIKIAAMDQCEMQCDTSGIKILHHKFTGTEDLTEYDAVIAQEPCDAAELIIKTCTEQNIPYCVILCGVPHARSSGVLDDDVYAWYAYLLSTYANSQFTIWHNGRFSSGCIYSEHGFDRKYFSRNN